MIRDGDRKASYRSWWAAKNKDARMENLGSWLKKEWDTVNGLVTGQHLGVSLLENRLDEIGVVMPPDMLYLYHLATPNERDFYPLEHADINEFKKDPEPYLEKLRALTSIVLLDQGRPHIALGSKLFRNCELVISDRDGRIDFAEHNRQHIFDDQSLIILPPKPPMTEQEKKDALNEVYNYLGYPSLSQEELKAFLGLGKFPMDEKSHKILDDVISELKKLRIRIPENFGRIVGDLRIDPIAGTVKTVSQAADKPTNEA